MFICVRRRSRSDRGRTLDEKYYEQESEDQYREPEPEGQYLDQDFPEGFVNGKSNPILWCIFIPVL
jgi:hypothetical protein